MRARALGDFLREARGRRFEPGRWDCLRFCHAWLVACGCVPPDLLPYASEEEGRDAYAALHGARWRGSLASAPGGLWALSPLPSPLQAAPGDVLWRPGPPGAERPGLTDADGRDWGMLGVMGLSGGRGVFLRPEGLTERPPGRGWRAWAVPDAEREAG